jgi:hypothetical protein
MPAISFNSEWLRNYVTSWNITGSISIEEDIGIFNLPNPSSYMLGLGSIQLLTEMSARKLPGGKGRLVGEADNLTATSEQIV